MGLRPICGGSQLVFLFVGRRIERRMIGERRIGRAVVVAVFVVPQRHAGCIASSQHADLVIRARLGGRRNERINALERFNFKFAFSFVEAQLGADGDVKFPGPLRSENPYRFLRPQIARGIAAAGCFPEIERTRSGASPCARRQRTTMPDGIGVRVLIRFLRRSDVPGWETLV